MIIWAVAAVLLAWAASSYLPSVSTPASITTRSNSSNEPALTAPIVPSTASPMPAVIPTGTLAASTGDAPRLLLSIVGHVFDVTAGRDFYGKAKGYGFFAGTDATRAFATGEFTNDLNESVAGFTEDQCMAIEGWLAFYKDSSKYPFIGYLEGSAYIHPNAASILHQLADDYSDKGTSFTRTQSDIRDEITAKLLALEHILTPAYTDLMACAQRGHAEVCDSQRIVYITSTHSPFHVPPMKLLCCAVIILFCHIVCVVCTVALQYRRSNVHIPTIPCTYPYACTCAGGGKAAQRGNASRVQYPDRHTPQEARHLVRQSNRSRGCSYER